MYIEELGEREADSARPAVISDLSGRALVILNPKRALVGAGARMLFYPTLLYNVVRNKIQSEFRWWDRVDEHLLLGAVPFPADVPRLKALGVRGVVTLNESYETLVPTSLYSHHGIDHLVIPTRDYLFAPALQDIEQAVEFIHGNSLSGKTTYVHCKAGRGRSTTIVLCYLVKHKAMTPEAAYEYVRSIRPRVLLASSQWKAVQHYYHGLKESRKLTTATPDDLDYNSLVLITDSDLDGYEEETTRKPAGGDAKLACRVQHARQAAISRLSCLWIRGQTWQRASSRKKIANPVRDGNTGIDIVVY
ncbi:hypothetical protein M569_05757 [Genlisea aurea]|uniref:phosphatidylglycerophosphatase n=1 Tax=Genlisea aurea TaxID=192259 RepID=S8CQJ2_9LAMI|nr:hypothetical protein M569_05757 [Genlisea aurea]